MSLKKLSGHYVCIILTRVTLSDYFLHTYNNVKSRWQRDHWNDDTVVDMLHTEDIPEDQTALPSPEDLSGYILVKVRLILVDGNFCHPHQLFSHSFLFDF